MSDHDSDFETEFASSGATLPDDDEQKRSVWYPFSQRRYSKGGRKGKRKRRDRRRKESLSRMEYSKGDEEDEEEPESDGGENLHDYEEGESEFAASDVIHEKKVLSSRLPQAGTNIDDLRRKVDFHQFGKRFIIVGLNYECHTFGSMKALIDHINKESKQEEMDENSTHVLKFEDPVWIDVQNPSISDMKIMEKYFGLHPLTTEDIINVDTGEKWELFSEYMFVVFTGQVDDEMPQPLSITKLLPSNYTHHSANETQLNILVFPDYAITIHDRPIKGLDLLMRRIETEFEFELEKGNFESSLPQYKYDALRSLNKRFPTSASNTGLSSLASPHKEESQAISTKDTFIPIPRMEGRSILPSPRAQTAPYLPPAITDAKRTHIPSSDWILYAFLDAMVDMYIPFVDSLVMEVDNLDELVFMLSQAEQNDLLKRLGLSKRNVVTLRRLLLPKQKMTTYLASQPLRFLSHTVQLYLRDVLDHLQICLEKLEVARENLNQTHNNYLTKVQIEIAEASGRTDDFMNRITVIASLLGPMSLISSIWGMNVKVPGQDDNSLKWFFGINAGMAVMALVLVVLLRNKLISK